MSEEENIGSSHVVDFPIDHGWAKVEAIVRKNSSHLHPTMVHWVLNDLRDRHAALKIPYSISFDLQDIPVGCSEAAQTAAEAVHRTWRSAHDRVIVQMVQLAIELYRAKFESGPPPQKPSKDATAKIIEFPQG